MSEFIVHPFKPVFDKNSRVLILGSFPSVKSRENSFYYGHPQNRFWKVVAAVFGCAVPQTIEEKKEMLLQNGVALWDAAAGCEIVGSSDSSISGAVPTDLTEIFSTAKIEKVFCNGQAAAKIYNTYQRKTTQITATVLPSTSPANATFSTERLTEKWKAINISEIIT